MSVSYTASEIIRHAFHAVKQLGTHSGATITVHGLTLMVTDRDGDSDTYQFRVAIVDGHDALQFTHYTDRDGANAVVKRETLLADSDVKHAVRRTVAWVLS